LQAHIDMLHELLYNQSITSRRNRVLALRQLL